MDDAAALPPKKPRARRAAAPTTPDPIEIAMEAEASGRAPEGEARGLLADQRRLVRWQIARERTGFVLAMLAGLAGVAAAAGLALMCWNASRADGLVVESFLVPPDLAAQGVTGEVVARGLLDRLAELDNESNSLFATRFSDAWTRNTKIELPQTGVSLDEVDRLLRRWLGHETYLSGEVVRTTAGLRLAARSGAGRPAVAEGRVEDLQPLIGALAEQVYERTRPLAYAELLVRKGDAERARGRQIAEQVLTTSGDAHDRTLAYDIVGLALGREGRWEDALTYYKAAMASPDPILASVAASNAAGHERNFGHTAAAQRLREQSWAIARRARRAVHPGRLATIESTYLLERYDIVGAERVLRPFAGRQMPGGRPISNWWAPYANVLGYLHRTSAAERLNAGPGGIWLLTATGQWEKLLAAVQQRSPNGRLQPSTAAGMAIASTRLGRLEEARGVAAGLPADCDICWVARGVVAAADGDAAGAERAFDRAAQLAPQDPLIRLLIGQDRLIRGQPAKAAKDFAKAHELAPRWADPLEAWGEALLTQGDPAGAAKRFAQAEPFAPQWGRLRLKWGEALARLGKAAEAQAQWRAAAGLDLTDAERADLARLQGAK